MREYRKRKRKRRMSVPTPLPPLPCLVLAPEPSLPPQRIMEKTGPQPARSNTGFVGRGASSSFKNALELSQVFTFRGPRLAGMPVLL
jgi:hypothetical protein